MTAELKHTLVRATEDDLIVFLVPFPMSDLQTDAIDSFMDNLSERTGATLAVIPRDVVSDCQNYTTHDLLRLRNGIDTLIQQRLERVVPAEA